MKNLITILLIALSISTVKAQTPQAFKYQTVVRNTAGEVLNNKLVSFQIGIMRDSLLMVPSYYETHTDSTNDFGLISLEIGTGTPTYGLFDTINWGNDDYHLEIGLDTTGGSSYILMGTTQLLAVPYALYSENTINKDDEDWTRSGDYIFTLSDSVGIGNSTPGAKLDVAGNITQSNTGGSVFIGEGAGYSDDLSIKNNVAIGSYALYNNTDRPGLVAIGDSALFNNSIGVFANYQAVNNTAIGSKALFSNTEGWKNTGVGSLVLYSNEIGAYNNAMGFKALYNNINGSENTAVGHWSMEGNISGNYNTAIGSYALYSNTDGNSNTALGTNAISNNTTGSYNTATGNWALSSNTTGSYNTANGYMALDYDTSGNHNCAIGALTMRDNFSGSYNTAIGNYSLAFNHDGNSNVAVGYCALFHSSDLNNLVAVGDSALYHNGTGASGSWDGNWNTAVGSKALYDNTTGFGNTAIGFESSMKNTTGNGNTSLGYGALQYNKTGHNNTAIGSIADLGNDYGSSNVIIGSSANLANSSGSQNTIIGTSAGHGLQVHTKSGCVLIGYHAGYSEYGDNKLYIENSNADSTSALIYGEFDNDILTLNANVGIKTTEPVVPLHVGGGTDASLSGGGYIVTGQVISDNIVIDENEILARDNGSPNNLHINRDGNNVIINEFNGSVGIGTPLPYAKLHVNGAMRLGTGVRNYELIEVDPSYPDGWSPLISYGGIGIGSNDGNNRQMFMFTDGSTTDNIFTVATSQNNGASWEADLVIRQDGNIGINTTTPARKLHINDVMRLEPRSSAPSGASAGDLYFDSTTSKLRCYDGSVWQDCW